jgi:hypothetical protein
MSTTGENVLISPCGGHCGLCPFYLAKDDPALTEVVVSWGYQRDKLCCQGCRPSGGKTPLTNCTRETLFTDLPATGSTCATYACSVEHGVDFCYQCPEFPCTKLQPGRDMADTLPHNLKVFLLCCLKRQGLAEWLKHYEEIYKLYMDGKMVVGQGPQMTEDGLRKVREFHDQVQQIRERLQQNTKPVDSQE